MAAELLDMAFSIRAIAASFSANHGAEAMFLGAPVAPGIGICAPAGDAASASFAATTKQEDRDNGVLLQVSGRGPARIMQKMLD